MWLHLISSCSNRTKRTKECCKEQRTWYGSACWQCSDCASQCCGLALKVSKLQWILVARSRIRSMCTTCTWHRGIAACLVQMPKPPNNTWRYTQRKTQTKNFLERMFHCFTHAKVVSHEISRKNSQAQISVLQINISGLPGWSWPDLREFAQTDQNVGRTQDKPRKSSQQASQAARRTRRNEKTPHRTGQRWERTEHLRKSIRRNHQSYHCGTHK